MRQKLIILYTSMIDLDVELHGIWPGRASTSRDFIPISVGYRDTWDRVRGLSGLPWTATPAVEARGVPRELAVHLNIRNNYVPFWKAIASVLGARLMETVDDGR